MTEPKKTALYDEHIALSGRMVEFAGYMLPVQYDGIGPIAEHMAVRHSAGVFDIDHMGKIMITGPEVVQFLQNTLSVNIKNLAENRAAYAIMLNEEGGVIDDVMVYKVNDGYMLIVNAGNHTKDIDWLFEQSLFYDVLIMDMSEDLYLLAIQGPKSTEILNKITDDIDLEDVTYHTLAIGHIDGIEVLFAAVGYTGEYGFEIYFDSKYAIKIWKMILEAGGDDIKPCGLAARDSLRFEAAMSLYGHELSENIDPLTAGLSFAVDFGKSKFIGKEPLLKLKNNGVDKKIVGLEMIDKAVPRKGYEIFANGNNIGYTTSGMKSPTLNKFLALAIIDIKYTETDTVVQVKIRDAFKNAKVVSKPFYIPAYRRKTD